MRFHNIYNLHPSNNRTRHFSLPVSLRLSSHIFSCFSLQQQCITRSSTFEIFQTIRKAAHWQTSADFPLKWSNDRRADVSARLWCREQQQRTTMNETRVLWVGKKRRKMIFLFTAACRSHRTGPESLTVEWLSAARYPTIAGCCRHDPTQQADRVAPPFCQSEIPVQTQPRNLALLYMRISKDATLCVDSLRQHPPHTLTPNSTTSKKPAHIAVLNESRSQHLEIRTSRSFDLNWTEQRASFLSKI